MNYCYKVKHKYLKTRKDGSREIEDYFAKFISEEDDEIFAISYRLLPESTLVRGDVSLLNDPKWQKAAKLSENLEEFEKEGLKFDIIHDVDKGETIYKLIEDEDTLKDFEMIKIAVDTLDKDTYGLLFILRSDKRTMYYNSKVLNENIPDIVGRLLDEGIIYKTIAPGDRARRERKRKSK